MPRKVTANKEIAAQPDLEVSPRVSLGLDAASDGQPKGVERFLGWLERELCTLAYLTDFPDPLHQRLALLHRETERVLEFTRGFIGATEKAEAP